MTDLATPTQEEIKTLCERLRMLLFYRVETGKVEANRFVSEAADALESLTTQVAELRAERDERAGAAALNLAVLKQWQARAEAAALTRLPDAGRLAAWRVFLRPRDTSIDDEIVFTFREKSEFESFCNGARTNKAWQITDIHEYQARTAGDALDTLSDALPDTGRK